MYLLAGDGSINEPCSTVYAGKAPESEPEVANVASFLRSHDVIQVFLSYHSAGQFLLIPWGWTNTPSKYEPELV